MRPPVPLVLALFLCAAPAASSDCAAAPGNLLAAGNCGFAKDLAGWEASPGAALSRSMDDEGGVLTGTSDPGGSLTILGPCVKVQAGTPYRFGARLRSSKGTVFFCSFNLFQYSDDQCKEGAEPFGSAGRPPGKTWEEVSGSATTADGVKSVQLRPACSGEPGFEVQFDDFVLGSGAGQSP